MNKLLIALAFLPLFASGQEVAVRNAGQDGVNTYRIPGLATSNSGTLLAIWDNRIENSRDLQGDINIGLSRSTDGGQTWLPLQTVLDMKQWGGLPEKYNGVSDACVLVDKKSGRIWVAGLWMHGVLDKDGRWVEGLNDQSKQWQHQWGGRASQEGVSPKQTCQFLLTYSDDDGESWSEPINITAATKRYNWWLFAPAPGQGITMDNGTLVFPTQGRDSVGMPFSNITYSVDGGKSWVTSNPAYTNTTECAVVELGDGSLMLNMRDNRNRAQKGDSNGRAVFTTKDMGKTWIEHPSSHGALIEPVCMASLHKHTYARNKSVLLFCNPSSKDDRNNIRLKVSTDQGLTWSEGFLLDEGDGFGYSCITSIDSNTIGVLWEGSRSQMAFRRVTLKELGVKK